MLKIKEIKDLHKKLVKGDYQDIFLDLVWTHSQIVRGVAEQLIAGLEEKNIKCNKSLVIEGALLHDIGVYLCSDDELNPDNSLPKYLSHGHCGYDFLKKEGLSNEVARFPLTHTGTGITVEDIIRDKMPFKAEDVIPITLEEEIVCYADKFHTKYPSFNTFEEAKARLEKFDKEKGVLMDRFKRKFGLPDLEILRSKYAPWHKKMDKFFTTKFPQS